jgi:hypothetical protein
VQGLLLCGVAYAVTYVVANDAIAATFYFGYSRTSQAVRELSATGAPTRTFSMLMLPVWTARMVAFGIGVRKSSGTRRSLGVTVDLRIAFGLVGVLWLPFPMTPRGEMVNGTTPMNDVGYIVLTAATIVLILSQLAFGAVALGRWFRVYSLITAAAVLGFGGYTGTQSPKIPKGEVTPWLGLSECISIGAWPLWLVVLALILLRSTAPTRR